MPRVTPFDVEPQEIELLGPRFATFVNALLAAESARAGLRGEQLRTTERTTVADGGVDAHLVSSVATEWLPEGDTAWQFKASDLQPAACREELEGATWAQDLLRNGARYRLVLGKDLTADRVQARRDALVATVRDLGLIQDPQEEGRIEVLTVASLARWASNFPAISQSQLLGGVAPQVRPFEAWSASQRHQSSWIGHSERDDIIASIRAALSEGTHLDMRIAGPSGVGKTRLVMETVRHESLLPLVAYVRDAEGFDPSAMAMLTGGNHYGILVIDECTPRIHERLADQLRHDSGLRLVSIGPHQEDRGYPLRCPMWVVPGMPSEVLDEYLKTNYAGLSPEARRLVVDHVAGNVRYAAVLAEKVLDASSETVADLVNSGDLRELLALELPEGEDFFFSQALALVERFGFEGGLEEEIGIVARFVGTSDERLRAVVQELDARGLVETHGRYRAIAPDPLATYLAAQAWQTWGSAILDELLPRLEGGMRTSFFRRAAALGRYQPVRSQFARLLEEPELFGTLHSIEERHTSELLRHLAVVAPEETMDRVSAAVDAVSIGDLQAMENSRRDLVWALEKLAWHSDTFEAAANALLKLSLAENESYANNATGVWTALFGTMLPATAASPAQRRRYLRDKGSSNDSRVRDLVVKACAAAMDSHESVTVSGELQGGTVVEQRGMPSTWGEAAEYRVAMAELLRELCDDSDEQIAAAAREAIIGTVHPFADDALVWPRLKPILMSLNSSAMEDLRREAEGLIRLHERVRGEEDEYRRPELVTALTELLSELPQRTEDEYLESLASREPWDFSGDDAARSELTGAVLRKVQSDGVSGLVEWAVDQQPPSAWYIGQALAAVPDADPDAVLAALTARLPATERMLAGYLAAMDEEAVADVFDEYLDQGIGGEIESELRLRLTVRGPVTDAAAERAKRIAATAPVLPAAQVLMPWGTRLQDEHCLALLESWTPRITSQREYNATVDWANMWLHRREEVAPEIASRLADLLLLRRDFPELRQEGWDWSQLANHVLKLDPVAIADLLLDLVSSSHFMLTHREEARVLKAAAKASPAPVWDLVADRLESADWRVEMSLRGAFLHAIPLEVIVTWIGGSTARAELVADIAPVGGNTPSPYADYLLTEFGQSDRVAGALAGELMSGTWVGAWSNRIKGQIEQMKKWLEDDGNSPGVKDWARQMKVSLERQLAEAIQREAEEFY